MNNWRKQFEEHTIHKILDEINKLIEGTILKTTETSILDQYTRFIVAMQVFKTFINNLNPECITKSFLENVVTILVPLRDHLVNFIQTENITHLQNANNQADRLFDKYPYYALSMSSSQQEELSGKLVSVVESSIQVVSEQSKNTKQNLSKIQIQSDKVADQLKSFENTINSQKGRLDQAIAEFQRQFSDAEASRRKKVEENERNNSDKMKMFRDDIEKQIKTLIDQKQKDFDETVKQFSDNASQTIDELESKKKQAADLVQITANITVTGDYEMLASQEKRSANIWRYIAVSFMGILILAAGFILWLSFMEGEFDWKMVLFRYVTAAILVFPAVYAMTESGHHRKMEQKYRRMQLELASIDPFIESLPQEKRYELKKALAERMFAQTEPSEKEPGISINKVLSFTEKVFDKVGKK